MSNKIKEQEIQTKQATLQEIIDQLEKYRVQLHESKYVSPTEFNHMQTSIHGCKNIVRDLFGAPRKGDTAWVK